MCIRCNHAIVQIIFSFWSFEISKGILRNQKFIIGLDSFLTNVQYIWPLLDNTSLCIDYPVESCKIAIILFGSNDVAKSKGSLVETAVWPIPFLINMLTALFFLFIIIIISTLVNSGHS